jgi:DNA polymerase alpha subunit B
VRVRDKAPDKLILMGPFLDAAHPMIAAGTVMDSFDRPVTYEDVYKEEIIPKLARLARACENARTELIIVPSASEARIDFPLPQPPLSALKPAIWEFLVKELPATVKFVSNPATVRVGDLDMYVTSADALSTLNSNVLFKQAENGIGRVDACMEQFLKSRSMFPVTPSALRIEPSMRSLLDLDDRCVPHIFVSPSLAGKRFFKKVADRIFVNPGFMSDATGASSSVAELVISAPADAQGATDLYSRVSGDAIKL